MSDFRPFEVAETALHPGVTLIEASAGTGKTYTIAGIFLRLVLEQRIPINRILAVTYTVAATAELRDRVRRRLHEALEDLRRGESEDLITQRFLDTGDPSQGCRDLHLAVQSFDEAQIFTIHGFCQRILHESSFESGLSFDVELLADPTAIFEDVAKDFWRSRFYQSTPLLARLALAGGHSPDSWIALLQRLRNHPDIAIIPPPGDLCCEELLRKIDVAFDRILTTWRIEGERIERLLTDEKSLSRDKSKSNFSLDGITGLVASMSELTHDLSKSPPACLLACEQLSRSEVLRCTKSTGTPPSHPFFDQCEEFRELTALYFHQLTHDFLSFARSELPIRKERRNVVTYDDLTTRLRDALRAPDSDHFTARIAGKYHAALLDEFQDTDPIQYDIFRKLFGKGAHQLVYIGDPKQAIYGFRGADVFTYLKAAGSASHRFTLQTNFRSEQTLLDGVNAFFNQVTQPFLISQIGYLPVSAPAKPKKSFVAMSGCEEAPLRFRWLADSCNQEAAELAINRAVADDIARYKASGARLGDRPLAFSDMAVLVRSNAQASNLQKLLRARGIKSALKSDASVFQSLEAAELLRLLNGMSTPGDSILLKTALATRIVGLDAAELVQAGGDERSWQDWVDRFASYRKLWETGGFIGAFRQILIELRLRERLIQLPGGERSLTNFLHLAELLHQAEREQRLTPGTLCAWLQQRRTSGSDTSEDDQLRLESDDDAVLLATIHKSKGLEYPVVFCPFLWKAGDSTKRTDLVFHDPDEDHRLTLDLRARKQAPESDRQTGEERMAEALRSFYVAITRAQNRCIVYGGDISGLERSPLAHFIGNTEPRQALQTLAQQKPRAVSFTEIAGGEAAKVAVQVETGGVKAINARIFDRFYLSNKDDRQLYRALPWGRPRKNLIVTPSSPLRFYRSRKVSGLHWQTSTAGSGQECSCTMCSSTSTLLRPIRSKAWSRTSSARMGYPVTHCERLSASNSRSSSPWNWSLECVYSR